MIQFRLLLLSLFLLALLLQRSGCGHAEMLRLCGYRSIPVPAETAPVPEHGDRAETMLR